jgi:hypothetical protein
MTARHRRRVTRSRGYAQRFGCSYISGRIATIKAATDSKKKKTMFSMICV